MTQYAVKNYQNMNEKCGNPRIYALIYAVKTKIY
jgi:hypothetical protein